MNNHVDEKQYFDKMHRFGRIMTVLTLVVFFGIPLVVCAYFDIMPTFAEVLAASSALLMIFVPAAFAEIFSEVPILGTSYYLSSITGNIFNLKLPAAVNAQKIANVEKGTDIADAISGIAVAVSSLTTMVIIAIGVFLLTPLKPVLESEAVATATNYILPALYGYLCLSFFNTSAGGGNKLYGIPKTLILPFLLAAALFLFIIPDSYGVVQGFIIIAYMPILYFITKFLYKKGKVRVELAAEKEEKAE